MELSQILETQRSFDKRMGWNRYKRCKTPEEIVAFMEHFTLVVVDELGEISRVRKKFLRNKQSLDLAALKKEVVDIFIFVMQGSMALKMDLEEEYMKRMKHTEKRFFKKGQVEH